MKINILIGISDEKKLPGIIIDLYTAYVLIQNNGSDRTLVITDLEDDPKENFFVKPLLNSIVDRNILTFLTDLKKRDQYVKCQNSRQIRNLIDQILQGGDKIFFYFTGHMTDGYLGITSEPWSQKSQGSFGEEAIQSKNTKYEVEQLNNLLSVEDILILIKTRTNPRAEVVLLFDCCQVKGLNLPFKFKPNFNGRNWGYLKLGKSNEFYTQEIIALSSAKKDQSSISSNEGSIYSIRIFELLRKYSSLQELHLHLTTQPLNPVSGFQTPCFFTSYPHLLSIWNWISTSRSVELIWWDSLFFVRRCLPSSLPKSKDVKGKEKEEVEKDQKEGEKSNMREEM